MRNVLFLMLATLIWSCNEEKKTDSMNLIKFGNPSSFELTVYDGVNKFGEIQKGGVNSFRQPIFEEPYDEYFDSNEPEYHFYSSFYHYLFKFNNKGSFEKIYLLAYSKEESRLFYSSREGMDTLYIANYEYPSNNQTKITLTRRDPVFAFKYGSSVNGDTANIRHDYFFPNGKLDSSVYINYYPTFVSVSLTKSEYEDNKETITTFNSKKAIEELSKTITDKDKETTFIYNSTGNLIKEILRLEPSKNLKIRIFKEYRYDDLIYQKTDSSFLKNDLLIKKITLINEKRTSVNYTSRIENNYEYKFDFMNNWIERTRFFREVKTVNYRELINEGIHITERKIKYYE